VKLDLYLWVLTISLPAFALPDSVMRERIYHDLKQHALTGAKSLSLLPVYQQSLYVDALWELADEGKLKSLPRKAPLYVVAREVGRDLFRIHGTLRKNKNPGSSWYPFVKTSGCIAQRENTYNGVSYQDQRDLLDIIMRSSHLEPIYENEGAIRGVLSLMEIDAMEGPVTEEDLKARGII
jgi:hypothetical protein